MLKDFDHHLQLILGDNVLCTFINNIRKLISSTGVQYAHNYPMGIGGDVVVPVQQLNLISLLTECTQVTRHFEFCSTMITLPRMYRKRKRKVFVYILG